MCLIHPAYPLALAAIVMLVLTARRIRRRRLFDGNQDLTAPGALRDLARANFADVERCVQTGRRQAAVRLYREITGCGMSEARRAVDEMEASQPTVPVMPPIAGE